MSQQKQKKAGLRPGQTKKEGVGQSRGNNPALPVLCILLEAEGGIPEG